MKKVYIIKNRESRKEQPSIIIKVTIPYPTLRTEG